MQKKQQTASAICPDKTLEVCPHKEPTTPARTLDQIEADIAQQLEMGSNLREMYLQAFAKASTPILIRIGECLKEEKEACKTAGISFADRIRERFGFSQRTAENYMTLAAEIPPDSPIAQLPYTKALALTALPSGEREQFAAEVGADNLSKKQLQDAIRAKQDAERLLQTATAAARIEGERRQKAEEAQEQAHKIAEHAEQALSSARRECEALRGQLNEAEKRLHQAESEVRYVETIPDDYDELKRQNALLARRVEDAETYAAEAEEALKEAQSAAQRAQMDAIGESPALAANPMEAAPFADACAALLNALFSAPYSASFFAGKGTLDLARYKTNVENILNWANGTLDALHQAEDMQMGGVDYEVR